MLMANAMNLFKIVLKNEYLSESPFYQASFIYANTGIKASKQELMGRKRKRRNGSNP